jgi:hypothetical protein
MRVQESIDSIWLPHGNRDGLSYGQLANLFVTYVLHCLTHGLYQMEEWLASHLTVIQHSTGWDLTIKDATDDHLGRMLEVLGSTANDNLQFQRKMGRYIIQAYELPTDVHVTIPPVSTSIMLPAVNNSTGSDALTTVRTLAGLAAVQTRPGNQRTFSDSRRNEGNF